MKALVKTKKGEDGVVLMDVPEPVPGRDEIKVKVRATGICGTDLHIMRDEFETKPPVVMGHEYSGTVCAVGADVGGFALGDRVVSLTTVRSCGVCVHCRAGLHMLCDKRSALGCLADGGFAEYLCVPAEKAFKLPDAADLRDAALSEPLACVVRSVLEKAVIKAGDLVYVSGPGAIGLLALQLARANGARVAVGGVSADAKRLELARALGAYGTVEADKESPEEAALRLTGGAGFDAAFECAGAAPSADACIRILKKTGQYVQVGLFGKAIPFDMDRALKKELSIAAGFTSTTTSWRRVMRLLETGAVDLKPLISAELPLSEWRRGFDMVIRKEGYKVLLVP